MNKQELERKIRNILIKHEYHWGYHDTIIEDLIALLKSK